MLTIEQFIERWGNNYNRYVDNNDVSAEYRDGYRCGEQEILNFAERHGNSRVLKNFISERIRFSLGTENEEIQVYLNGKHCAYHEMFDFLINEPAPVVEETAEEEAEAVAENDDIRPIQAGGLDRIAAVPVDAYANIASAVNNIRMPYYTQEEIDAIVENLSNNFMHEIYAGENDRRYRELDSRIQELQNRTDYLNARVDILETN